MGVFIPSQYSGINPDAILALTEAGLAVTETAVSISQAKQAEKAAKKRRRQQRRRAQQQTPVVVAPEPEPMNWPLLLGAGALLVGGYVLLQKKGKKKK
jgi:LPXTG-motif cell wall-anchored protein